MTNIAKQGGFAQFFNRVVTSGIWARLGYTTKAAYVVLVLHAKHQAGYMVSIGFGSLATQAGIPRSCAQSAVDELLAKNLLRVVQKGHKLQNGTFTSNVYQLLIPKPGVLDQSKRASRREFPAGGRTVGTVHPDTVGTVHPRTGRTVEDHAVGTSAGLPSGRSHSIDSESKLDEMDEGQLAEMKEMAIAMAEEPLRPFLRKADPRKHPILRVRMAALLG